MSGLIEHIVNWFKTASDFAHHTIVLGLSLSSVPVVNYLSPSVITSLCLGSVGVQLGKQLWVANVAGPTMRLNMEKKDFSEISARLFPKFGMVAIFSGTVALAAYNALHPTPDILTYLLSASLASHLLQSYMIFPYVSKQQVLLRKFEEGSAERKKAAMRFGISHGISVLIAYGVIGANLYFFYKTGQHIQWKK
ncbi:uncharacterized protein LOC134851720 isoform X2 [Symsagittifera roscoffensis]|uniref:uncharacterized protein LOC134851720 isoform X2 n=1 Tax=Symsagittifera roscoffensis TaxID=84072 RepID=UPI00307C210F